MLELKCSNHSVPTILFNDLAQSVKVGLFSCLKFASTDFLGDVSFVLVLSTQRDFSLRRKRSNALPFFND